MAKHAGQERGRHSEGEDRPNPLSSGLAGMRDKINPMTVMLAALFAFMVAIIVVGSAVRAAAPIAGEVSEPEAAEAEQASEEAVQESKPESKDYRDLAVPLKVEGTYDYCANVKVLLQNPWFSGGCEPVSLTAMLNAMGYDVTAFEICDDYLEYGDSFVETYSGSPYYNGMAYPPAIVKCGNKFLEAQGSTMRFAELTGHSFSELVEYTAHGVPVLVWTTMYLERPIFTGTTEGEYTWYMNEHCVLVYGISDDIVLVMDPLEGLVERNRRQFESIYDECGKMAVSLAL